MVILFGKSIARIPENFLNQDLGSIFKLRECAQSIPPHKITMGDFRIFEKKFSDRKNMKKSPQIPVLFFDTSCMGLSLNYVCQEGEGEGSL